jgi:DNA invertase Pin-like site-specific DNA recombinase
LRFRIGQGEGIERILADPKLRSQKYPGGKQRIDRDKVLSMKAEGKGPAVIAKALGISRMSVYRVLQEVR